MPLCFYKILVLNVSISIDYIFEITRLKETMNYTGNPGNMRYYIADIYSLIPDWLIFDQSGSWKMTTFLKNLTEK